jgi:hypothetical protein
MTTPPEVTYVGGVRLGAANVTWPLVRLTLDLRGIEAGLRGPLALGRVKLPMPFSNAFRVSLTWAEIERIAPAQGMTSAGVAFHYRHGHRMVFWSSAATRKQILGSAWKFAPASLVISDQSVALDYRVAADAISSVRRSVAHAITTPRKRRCERLYVITNSEFVVRRSSPL